MCGNTSQIYIPNYQLKPLTTDASSLSHIDHPLIWGIYKPHQISSTQGQRDNIIDKLVCEYRQHPLIMAALEEFGIEEELGMLTRLDHDTAGMIRFAHTRSTKQQWLLDQQKQHITKIYHCTIHGYLHNKITIDAHIGHHKYDERRMVIDTPSTAHKIRGVSRPCTTYLTPISHQHNTTLTQALIHQGMRHQIRIHCASTGHYIIGESLYHKSNASYLHLRSCGLQWSALGHHIMVADISPH